jgi:hypothetical protein
VKVTSQLVSGLITPPTRHLAPLEAGVVVSL